jgi:hypothetical protein
MPIFTEGSFKPSLGNEMGGATAAGGALARVEALLTAEKLRTRFLFGIPMWSFMPDPVSKKRAEYTPEMLQDAIQRAANEVELELSVSVQPQEKTKRLPFDRNEYYSLGYFQLPDAPITAVTSLAVKPAGDAVDGGFNGAVYVVNTAWIDNAHLQRGQINIIPFLPATAMAPMPGAVAAGGAAFLSILGHMGWVPAFWEIVYITGFKEGRVPLQVNELIGATAAIQILSEIGATNRIGSYSVGLDGAQQSVDTGGPNVYADRIAKLEEKRKSLRSKLKVKLGHQIFSGNV